MRSRQLYASLTASSAGSVYFDIPDTTIVRGVAWAIYVTGTATGDGITAEISLNSAGQQTTNDAQGIISIYSSLFHLSTSGAVYSPPSVYMPAHISLKAGNRVYLNVVEAGSATWAIRALVWFD